MSKYLSAVEWTNKFCIFTMECPIAMQTNKTELLVILYVNLTKIMLSERSQTHKKEHIIYSFIFVKFKNRQRLDSVIS